MKNGQYGEMKYNEFKQDLEYSFDSSEDEVLNEFYRRKFPNLKSIKFCDDLQTQRKGVDKILYFNNGNSFTIDEKKRRSDYGDILLEIWSIDRKKRGWLFTTQCDYIVYIILSSKKIYFLPTILLKRAWVSNSAKWLKYPPIIAQNNGYKTESRAIKPEELLNAIKKEMSDITL